MAEHIFKNDQARTLAQDACSYCRGLKWSYIDPLFHSLGSEKCRRCSGTGKEPAWAKKYATS